MLAVTDSAVASPMPANGAHRSGNRSMPSSQSGTRRADVDLKLREWPASRRQGPKSLCPPRGGAFQGCSAWLYPHVKLVDVRLQRVDLHLTAWSAGSPLRDGAAGDRGQLRARPLSGSQLQRSRRPSSARSECVFVGRNFRVGQVGGGLHAQRYSTLGGLQGEVLGLETKRPT